MITNSNATLTRGPGHPHPYVVDASVYPAIGPDAGYFVRVSDDRGNTGTLLHPSNAPRALAEQAAQAAIGQPVEMWD
jgi:hypothetical protein